MVVSSGLVRKSFDGVCDQEAGMHRLIPRRLPGEKATGIPLRIGQIDKHSSGLTGRICTRDRRLRRGLPQVREIL
jgi:hypothetical protein